MTVERTPELEALIEEVAFQVRVDGDVTQLPEWVRRAIAKGAQFRYGAEHYRCEFDCDRCHEGCETPNCTCGWDKE